MDRRQVNCLAAGVNPPYLQRMHAIFHVTRSGLGGWRVERIGSGDAEDFDTREQAEERARRLASEAGAESRVVLHDERGAIAGEFTGEDV